jgi:hypothetical protein
MRKTSRRVHIQGNNLLVLDENQVETRITFSHPIADVLEFQSIAVVMLAPKVKSGFNENIYGVDYRGNIVWQIHKREYVYEDSPYTGIIKEEEKVRLFNWDGAELSVDPLTGRILNEKWGK